MSIVLTRTPYRISFLGGGTDYPAWYLQHGGRVLSTTIDKYCYITCRILPPFFNIRHRIVWSHIEMVQETDEILHPAVREALHFLGFTDEVGLEIHHQGDLPARAGLGSSSSFAVGLILGLRMLAGMPIDKKELALAAIRLEQERLRDHVGSQDQTAAAYGGFNIIDFDTDGSIRVSPLALAPERLGALERNLMLFYTGTNRFASTVAADVIANMAMRERQLFAMRRLVDDAVEILESACPLDEFGRLLHDTWMLKRQLSSLVSNDGIDGIYARAVAAGALGGKLLGAGTAGFMLFYVPIDRQEAVTAALGDLVHVPFHFETGGAMVLLTPENNATSIKLKEHP